MAITYPLDMPTVSSSSMGVSEITLRAANIVAISESPFTMKQQVIKHPGERWEASVKVGLATRALAEEWVAFLVSLRGMEGTFRLGDPQCKTPRGTASVTPGTPLVMGGGQLGDTIVIDGLPASASTYLLPGDYLQTHIGSLHKVLTTTASNGSGVATVDIWPSMRTSPADNSTISLFSTRGIFRLRTNTPEWSIYSNNQYNIQFDCIEAV